MMASLIYPSTVSNMTREKMIETYQVVPHCHITYSVKAFGEYAWAADLHDARDSSGMLYPCLMGRRMKKLFMHQKAQGEDAI